MKTGIGSYRGTCFKNVITLVGLKFTNVVDGGGYPSKTFSDFDFIFHYDLQEAVVLVGAWTKCSLTFL